MLGEVRVARLALLDEEDLPRVLPVTSRSGRASVERDRPEAKARTRTGPGAPPAPPARAALLGDRYDDDWSRLAWVELRGPVSVEPRGPALDALIAKYPQYADARPQGPLLRLRPRRLT